MRPVFAACLAILAAFVAPAVAAERTSDVLLSATSPAELRVRLDAHASAVATSDPDDAGAARYYRGVSFQRAGLGDSAIASFRAALDLRAADADRLALADALLRRRADGDPRAAIVLLEPALARMQAEGAEGTLGYEARLAWARFLSGQADSARQSFRTIESRLSLDPVWRYRLARVALATGDVRHAYPLLLPLLLASRHQDAELVDLLGQIVTATSRQQQIDTDLRRALAARDAIENRTLAAMKGRRVRFAASDDEYVSAIALERPARGRPRTALVLVAAGDTLADYDSLGTALRGAGFAVMMVETRGSGGSVTPNCPLPDTWQGREEALQARVARDLRDALDVLAGSANVDTSACVAVGAGAAASMVAQAAELDRRIVALVLVSPRVPEVERGPLLDRLRRLQLPVFFQLGAEDLLQQEFVDTLFRSGPARLSRIAEARSVGQGMRQFGHEPGATARLVRWIKDVLTARRAARATPPSTRR